VCRPTNSIRATRGQTQRSIRLLSGEGGYFEYPLFNSVAARDLDTALFGLACLGSGFLWF
jgi:hypothetical protein